MTNAQAIIAALVAIVLAALLAVSINPAVATALPALGLGVVVGGLIGALNTGHPAPAVDPNAPGPNAQADGPPR